MRVPSLVRLQRAWVAVWLGCSRGDTVSGSPVKINWKKIKGGCQSGRKVVTHDSNSDLPLKYGFCKKSFLSE